MRPIWAVLAIVAVTGGAVGLLASQDADEPTAAQDLPEPCDPLNQTLACEAPSLQPNLPDLP